ncbi:MAG TPA: ABC transporter ATP-binding protein [Thermoanaerobaculia bacterium]|nr:ABC transporter ATP-binding protein [Thermoanaerobaculia bacterium]
MSAARGELVLEEVTKEYVTPHHTIRVLDGISARLGPGMAVVITGPSGSGKSTLLHIVGALEVPTSGRVIVDDQDPHRLAEAELARFRNRAIGFVFQDHHLLPQFDVLQNVVLPTIAGGGSPGEGAADRARRLLAAVGLAERTSHRPAELSGGERQRVAIARALINRPSLLLCDEPTGNLDQRTADAVADLLFELHAEEGGSMIVVTHSQELAGRFAQGFELEREGLRPRRGSG